MQSFMAEKWAFVTFSLFAASCQLPQRRAIGGFFSPKRLQAVVGC